MRIFRSKSAAEISALAALILLFGVSYTYNLGGWLISDDEGTDLYEVWRLAEGDQPGVDFIAEQLPLYLQLGAALVKRGEQQVTPLRMLSVVQILGAALVLGLVVRKMWGVGTAVLAIACTLTSGLIVSTGRIFRPDPMMLAWEMVGLALVLYAVHTKQRRWWALAGAAYGLAFSFKLFGVIPLLGLIFFFAHELWRRRHEWTAVFMEGLTFAIPFLLIAVGLTGLLFLPTGFYFLESFQQHASLGEGMPLLTRLRITLTYYASLFIVNGIFLLWPALWLLNRRQNRGISDPHRLLLWQLASPLIFLGVTRPMYLRYFIFLVPVLALLLAYQLMQAYLTLKQNNPSLRQAAPFLILGLILFATVTTRPAFVGELTRREDDSRALAAYVAAQTDPDDWVLSDYAMINYLADRASIYEASIIAAGRIRSGIVTGEMLVDRMETEPVKMVLLHVPGGSKEPDHLYFLHDYEQFRAYLQAEFSLLTEFDRRGQLIEIYVRP